MEWLVMQKRGEVIHQGSEQSAAAATTAAGDITGLRH